MNSHHKWALSTRFGLSVLGVAILGALAFYAIAKGEAVTPPLCVTGIGTIVGGYQWGRSYTNAKIIESNTNTDE
jgi:hypothetical protein